MLTILKREIKLNKVKLAISAVIFSLFFCVILSLASLLSYFPSAFVKNIMHEREYLVFKIENIDDSFDDFDDVQRFSSGNKLTYNTTASINGFEIIIPEEMQGSCVDFKDKNPLFALDKLQSGNLAKVDGILVLDSIAKDLRLSVGDEIVYNKTKTTVQGIYSKGFVKNSTPTFIIPWSFYDKTATQSVFLENTDDILDTYFQMEKQGVKLAENSVILDFIGTIKMITAVLAVCLAVLIALVVVSSNNILAYLISCRERYSAILFCEGAKKLYLPLVYFFIMSLLNVFAIIFGSLASLGINFAFEYLFRQTYNIADKIVLSWYIPLLLYFGTAAVNSLVLLQKKLASKHTTQRELLTEE